MRAVPVLGFLGSSLGMTAAIPSGIDGKSPAGWLDRSVHVSCCIFWEEKVKEWLKSWVAQLIETHVKCCVLCAVSGSALFTITCQEVNADGSIPGLKNSTGRFSESLLVCGASNRRCWRPVTSQGAQRSCSKIFLLNLVLIVAVEKLKIELWSCSVDGNQPMRGFLGRKQNQKKIS